MACALSHASMNVRSRSLRNVNQRSRSGAKDMSTSLKRRKAPLPSIAWESFVLSSPSSTIGMNRSIQRYCSREDDGIDAEVVRVGADPRMHLRIGDAVDDTKHFAGRQMKVAVHLGCIVFEGILERLPVHGYIADGRPPAG